MKIVERLKKGRRVANSRGEEIILKVASARIILFTYAGRKPGARRKAWEVGLYTRRNAALD